MESICSEMIGNNSFKKKKYENVSIKSNYTHNSNIQKFRQNAN